MPPKREPQTFFDERLERGVLAPRHRLATFEKIVRQLDRGLHTGHPYCQYGEYGVRAQDTSALTIALRAVGAGDTPMHNEHGRPVAAHAPGASTHFHSCSWLLVLPCASTSYSYTQASELSLAQAGAALWT